MKALTIILAAVAAGLPLLSSAVAHSNVRLTVDNILERSTVIRALHDKGELMVVGAMHDVSTGTVSFLE